MPEPSRFLSVFPLVLLLSAPMAQAQAPVSTLVKDINASGFGLSQKDSFPGQLTAVAGKVFFFATEPSSGREAWVTDGTAAGTELLGDLDAGQPPWTGSVNNRFFWVASGASGRLGLWASDGTPAGTVEVFPRTADLELQDPNYHRVTIAGHRVFFEACASGSGCHIWTSDGTVAGTGAVPGGPGLFGSRPIAVGNRAFFFVLRRLWVSDGTAAGTRPVREIPDAFPDLPSLTAVGNRLFFLTEPGRQLWVSDGTAGGTLPVSSPQPFSLNVASFLRASGNGVLFSASDPAHGDELWTSDGTRTGTRRLSDFAAAHPFANGLFFDTLFAAGGRPVFFVTTAGETRAWTASGGTAALLSPARVVPGSGGLEWNGKVFFVADDGHSGAEPWVTDGTPQGTRRLADLCPGSCSSRAFDFKARSRAVYFADDTTLWRTDGTAAGTQRLSSSTFFLDATGASFDVAEVGSTVFVSSITPYGIELWSRDAAGQNRVVTDIARREPSSWPGDLIRLGDRLLFTAAENGSDRTLWQSAAAADATSISGFFRGSLNIPDEWGLIAGDGIAYFFFPDVDGLLQLWRTDGTAAGTLQVLSLPDGVAASNRLPLTLGTRALFHGRVLFVAPRETETGEIFQEIWESDGTAAGTRPAPYLPADLTSVGYLQTLGDELYFAAANEEGIGIWRSDGTVAGTRKIAAVRADQSLQASRLGTAVFFIALGATGNGGNSRHLWRTDGTPEGTSDFLDTGSPANSHPVELAVAQGGLYLFEQDDKGASTVRRSDGTPAGTAVLRSFSASRNGRPASHFPLSFAGKLFFVMADAEHGAELWSTDGTAAGTTLFKDIAPGPAPSLPASLTAAGGRLFFTAHDGEHGRELWTSDGTAAGTRMVQDLAPQALSSSPEQLTAVGDRLYFSADDGLSGRELWSLPLAGAGGCLPASTRLCLGGGRYQVEAAWRTSQGQSGLGTAVPLAADTGSFWFFSASNIETIVKLLDGQSANGHVWFFYGALSNVEYTLTVTDTWTGLTRRYFNPLDQLASVGDTHAFGPLGANAANPSPPLAIAAPSLLPQISERQKKAAAPCQAGAQRLCLNDGRFAVEVAWKDFQGQTGKGTAVPLSGDTGTFWFFNAANIELVVKALDGRPSNGHFWIFYGALSSVEYTVTVTDTQTGTMRTYTNPSGRFASVADTQAF